MYPMSPVRNRALHILDENARWDEENRFDAILPANLAHVTGKKSIAHTGGRFHAIQWLKPG